MKIFNMLVLVALFSSNGYAQTVLKTIIERTPWGVNVSTDSMEEAILTDRIYGDDYHRNQGFTEVTYLETYGLDASSTDKFNCHGWAWYMSEPAGGSGLLDPRDIGITNSTLPYISDSISYKVVSSESEADIVWWEDGSHSALTTETSGVWTSKWQYGPLVQHDWDDQPYGSTGLVYYKRCFHRITGLINSNYDEDHCKVEFENLTISDGLSVIVEFEDWVFLDGSFTVGTGVTLDIKPTLAK